MDKSNLKRIYLSRPFKTRNADEYDLSSILDLFVDPTDGITGPFDFSNSIIKGKMGSGKTMYLRANYAYYLYTLVPTLLEEEEIVLPVYIRLSDFQHIIDPEQLYYAIIVKIVEEIVGVCNHLKSANELTRLHTGACSLDNLWTTDQKAIKILNKLQKLTAQEYVQSVTHNSSVKGSITTKFLETYADYNKMIVSEMKRSDRPSFSEITDAYNELLLPYGGKLLILFDEIGSINKKFFKVSDDSESFFEILMNQLRTQSFIRTKIAIYPHSFSDILKETRYGDIVELECNVTNNNVQYRAFMTKTISIMEKYIKQACGFDCKAEDVFEISSDNQLLIEQLINASDGNMRRLVHIIDASMNYAFSRNQGESRVTVNDIWEALKKQGEEMESQFQDTERDFLEKLAKICKNRSTNKFTFPNKSTVIGKYTNMSEEYNIIKINEAGTGRKGTVYSFDFAYCIYRDIPTHYIKDSEKIDKSHSTLNGEPIKRVAQLTDELLIQSDIRGKIDGKINFVGTGGNVAFVEDAQGKEYYVSMDSVIGSDKKEKFHIGDRLRFTVSKMGENAFKAEDVEIL